MVIPKIEPSWLQALEGEFTQPYFSELKEFLVAEKQQHVIYPPGSRIFAAFDYTPFDKIKAVILGQDPYHGPGQANGLCFSVNDGIRCPPSLNNIFRELKDDIGCDIPFNGNLEGWAKQGVFLLNATLTVRQNLAGSHQNKGWEKFTDAVIRTISDKKENIVFLLWGNYAKNKVELINGDKHLILTAAHPSPLARGAFFGSRHFSKTNAFLKSKGVEPVNWCL
jgi:uracil-DNA glycosylase